MTIDERLYPLLRAAGPVADIVGDRIYPDAAPQSAALPYVVHQQADRRSVMTHGGPADLDSYEWTITVHGTSRRQCKAVMRAIRDAINGARDGAGRTDVRILGITDAGESSDADSPLFGEEQGRHSMAATYSLWFKGEG